MTTEKASVLLVDDDKLIQKIVVPFLEKAGYKVRIANNGVEAMVKIRQEIPAILLTDRNMPQMDGLELVRRLRAAHRTAGMPIIIFSDLGKDDDAMLGYSAGADEYVPKPFQVSLLEFKMQSLLRRAGRTGSAADAHRGKVVAFFHGKGGVGTTTLAANTAVALTMDSASTVAMVDLNLPFSNAAMFLNVVPGAALAEIEAGKMDQLTDEDFSRFVGAEVHGVGVVAAAETPEQTELVSLPVVEMAIGRLRKANDYVLLDCAADFSERTLKALDLADLICLVTEPTLPAMKATKDCLRIFESLHYPDTKIQVIFNQTGKKGASEAEAAKFLGAQKFAFTVPFSETFEEAANTGEVVVGGSGAVAASLKGLAEKIRAGVRV